MRELGPRLGERSRVDSPDHLCDAVQRGDDGYVARSTAPVNATSKTGRTPLLNAVLFDQRRCLDALSRKPGFDVNAQYGLTSNAADRRATVLYRATAHDVPFATFVALIERYGADVNAANEGNGQVPLFAAVAMECPRRLEFLLAWPLTDISTHAASVLEDHPTVVEMVVTEVRVVLISSPPSGYCSPFVATVTNKCLPAVHGRVKLVCCRCAGAGQATVDGRTRDLGCTVRHV